MGLQFDPELSIAPQTAGNPLVAAGVILILVFGTVLLAIIAMSCRSEDVAASPFDHCRGLLWEAHDRCIADVMIEQLSQLSDCGDHEPDAYSIHPTTGIRAPVAVPYPYNSGGDYR